MGSSLFSGQSYYLRNLFARILSIPSRRQWDGEFVPREIHGLRLKSSVIQTQMKEALRTFKTLTQIESLQNTPMILFLNKTDLFMEHLVDIPISNYFLDYDGGSDYHLACQYFAQRFRKLDRRKNGKLFFCLTNAADADSFKQTFRHLRLNVLRDPLALQTSWHILYTTITFLSSLEIPGFGADYVLLFFVYCHHSGFCWRQTPHIAM